MPRDGKVTTLSLLLSVFLHLSIIAALPVLRVRKTPPKEKMRVQVVVRIPRPARALAPLEPPPLPRPKKRPEPKSLTTTVRPRRPQALSRPQRRPDPTRVPDLSRPQVRPVDINRPNLPSPRQPARLRRHNSLVGRPTPVPTFSPPQVSLAQVAVPKLPEPRQPSTQWRQATVVQQRAADSRQENPIAAYLARVRAAIERHKRYPHSARRAGITGRAVLEFVILPGGQVIEPRIADSASSGIFGSAALETLRRASPMPPFSPGINQERLLVKIPIFYELSGRQ